MYVTGGGFQHYGGACEPTLGTALNPSQANH